MPRHNGEVTPASMQPGSELQTRDVKASGAVSLKNPKHEKLAREYAAGNTQADAWRATFGREPSTGNASRTFSRPEIQARVEYLRGEFNRMAGISLASLQARLLRIADANVAALLESDGGVLRLRDVTKLPAAATAAISELEIADDGAIKLKTLKTTDRLHAVDSLLKSVGGFSPDNTGERGATLEQLIERSMEHREHRGPRIQLNVVTGVPPSDYLDDKGPSRTIQDTIHDLSTSAGECDRTEKSVRRVRL